MNSPLSTVYPECRQIYPVLPKVMDEWKSILEHQAELQRKATIQSILNLQRRKSKANGGSE